MGSFIVVQCCLIIAYLKFGPRGSMPNVFACISVWQQVGRDSSVHTLSWLCTAALQKRKAKVIETQDVALRPHLFHWSNSSCRHFAFCLHMSFSVITSVISPVEVAQSMISD